MQGHKNIVGVKSFSLVYNSLHKGHSTKVKGLYDMILHNLENGYPLNACGSKHLTIFIPSISIKIGEVSADKRRGILAQMIRCCILGVGN